MTNKVSSHVLSDTAVGAGTYGGTTQHAVFTVDSQGRLVYAANATPSIATTQLTGTINALQVANNQTYGVNITGSSGSTTGNAGTVTNGVYSVGNQTITGTKTFNSKIIGSISGDADGNAGTVTNGVYTTGNQTIAGIKTFSSTIVGSVNGNAGSVTNGVYTNGSYADPAWITSLSKSKVGLGNVDNTADANKSVSYATTAGNGGVTSVNGSTGAVTLSSIITRAGGGSLPGGQTSYALTDVPSGAKKITLIFTNVICSGNPDAIIQLGSSSYTTSGYTSIGQLTTAYGTDKVSQTSGFGIYSSNSYALSGHITLTRSFSSNHVWTCSYVLTYGTTGMLYGAGWVSLGGTVDRVRLYSVAGSTTFTGIIQAFYE